MTLPQIGSRYFDCDSGDFGDVLVDGLLRPRITRCMTGSRGWAEELVRDGRGCVLNRKRDAVKRRIIRGVVVFKPRAQ